VNLLRILMMLVLPIAVASALWSWTHDAAPATPLPPLQIEVLNSCGVDGLAELAAQRLRALGHDVTRVADAGMAEFEHTVILDRRGRDRLSRELARRAGPCPVLLEQIEDPVADLTLILGADWQQMALFSDPEPVSGL